MHRRKEKKGKIFLARVAVSKIMFYHLKLCIIIKYSKINYVVPSEEKNQIDED